MIPLMPVVAKGSLFKTNPNGEIIGLNKRRKRMIKPYHLCALFVNI